MFSGADESRKEEEKARAAVRGGGGVSCPLLLQQRLYGAAVLLVASLEIRWFEFGLEGFSIVLTSGFVCAWHREVFLHLTINQSGPSPPGTGAVSLSLA